MRADVEGADELLADLVAETVQIEPHAAGKVSQEAARTVARMKASIARDTGAAADSIGADLEGLTAEVGPTVPYAPFIEYGTSDTPPQPFLGQSTDEVGFEKAVGDAVGL